MPGCEVKFCTGCLLSQVCSCTSSSDILVFHSSELSYELLFSFSCWKAALTTGMGTQQEPASLCCSALRKAVCLWFQEDMAYLLIYYVGSGEQLQGLLSILPTMIAISKDKTNKCEASDSCLAYLLWSYIHSDWEKHQGGSTDTMKQLHSPSSQWKSVFPSVSIILILHSTSKGAVYFIFSHVTSKNPCRFHEGNNLMCPRCSCLCAILSCLLPASGSGNWL